jgi:hypothetical protein
VTPAAALVLHDRTNADPHQVLALALDALIASGVWTTGRAWRRARRVTTLAPVAVARDDAARGAALKTLSPPVRAFLKAYRNALGGRFPPGSVGSRIAATGTTNGDNRIAAVTYGLRSR